MPNFPAQIFFQPLQAWSSYWLKLSQLMWSSGDVIARRGALYAGSDSVARLKSDFDGMASEKGRAAVDNTATTLRVAKAGMRPVQKRVTSNIARLKGRKKK